MISKVVAGKPLKGTEQLVRLAPIIKGDLLRLGGRLYRALVDTDVKHQLILTDKDPITVLIIHDTDLHTLHRRPTRSLSELRLTYWIVNGRNAVQKLISRCHKCIRYPSPRTTQIMGNLPASRVNPGFAFAKSGTDYVGPFKVRLIKCRGKGTLKYYIALFVCMAIRAVHLEHVEDYTSESFIAEFQRFTVRKGYCADLYSDQGTNFVDADKELRSLLVELTKRYSLVVYRRITAEVTRWHLNPPKAPHFSGIWEAAVKSANFI